MASADKANGVTETIVNMPLKTMDAGISVVPSNEASWNDLATVFGTRGEGFKCQCQRYKLQPREAFAHFPVQVRADRLREQTHCGHPKAGVTSGLVAYGDGEPVGWCAVEPRTAYAGLLRVYRVPWIGRAEDKSDTGVWAVTCFFTRAGFRRRGISRVLACAAVDFARRRGARALEGHRPSRNTGGWAEHDNLAGVSCESMGWAWRVFSWLQQVCWPSCG
jgi:GNAT superfamily N-acetyltransferase